MIRNEALTNVGPGWSGLVNRYFDFVDMLLKTGVLNKIVVHTVAVGRGMLLIQASTSANKKHGDQQEIIQDMLDKLAWAIERDSAKMCEVCGEKGYRRKSLPGTPNRCKQHYIELTNEMAESGEIDV